MMKTILHKADTRGHANHGWLISNHTFSFANYYNPERMHFGALRVLNDDQVMPGMGFGTHPHENMEIVSIPLSGALEHKDSMGNGSVIKAGEVQIMSAGTGIYHSEYNHSRNENVNFLQIWVFPKKKDIRPRYDQRKFEEATLKNQFKTVVAPNEPEGAVWINQDAWFNLGNFDKDIQTNYSLHGKENGAYIFVLEGDIEVEGQLLNKRDGFGIWEKDSLSIKSLSSSKVLLIEVPMI